MGIGIKGILVGLFGRKSGKDGVWDFLGKWVACRSQVKLEQVHNDGTQKLAELLRPGTVVIERGRGWTREIRIPDAVQSGMLIAAVTPTSVITPLVPVGLELPPQAPGLEPPPQALALEPPLQAQEPARGPC
jgi:hypothetical protein